RRKSIDFSMPVTVACQLMSSLVYLTDQPGKSACHPAKDKKGGFDSVLIKQVEQTMSVFNHPSGIMLPVRAINLAGKSLDMEVVLKIDAQDVLGTCDLSCSRRRKLRD